MYLPWDIFVRDVVSRDVLDIPRNVPRAETLGSEFGTTPSTAPQARLNTIGIAWICFGAVWTLLLIFGMTFLYRKRHTPTLRIRGRGLPLTFAGLVLLHLYWITVQLGYSVGPLAPEVAEFWIMSIWYPFGIALFQAGNSQFLHIARAQSRFATSKPKCRFMEENKGTKKMGWWKRVGRMDYSARMTVMVSVGMAVQLFVVVLIFLISRKFHPEFGIPGTEVHGDTPMEIAMKQGRGWEWWPSLFWQFLWAWVFAPIILWRSRRIRDTHGWQLQTMACCIAGLPAAPMWLVALYVPAMAPVNAVFVPPQWIALSIFVIEIFTVFVPCWQVRKHQNLRQETLDSIASWESKKLGRSTTETQSDDNSSSNIPPVSPTSTKVGGESLRRSSLHDPWKKLPSLNDNNTSSASDPEKLVLPTGESVLTMAALEHVLLKNPEPLRKFSATRDFSGENIAFLTAVAEWKSSLPPPFLRNRHDTSPELVRSQFTQALRIYVDFISPRDAEFPINIAWHELRKLEGVFERAARTVLFSREKGGATPFAEVDWNPSSLEVGGAPSSRGSQIPMVTTTPPRPPTSSYSTHLHPGSTSASGSRTPGSESTETLPLPFSGSDSEFLYKGDIPPSFDSSIFDAAQASIKYLVLTNTWPKYVRERRASESSEETTTTTATTGTGATMGTGMTGTTTLSVTASLKKVLGWVRPFVR